MGDAAILAVSPGAVSQALLTIYGDILAVNNDAFYRARLDQRIGVSAYDEALAQFVSEKFAGRPIVHAGTGFGSLIAVLAANGFEVCGIEQDPTRFDGAEQVRSGIQRRWPAAGKRFDLLKGPYPDAIAGTDWVSPDVVLLFTNVGAGWSHEIEDRVIATFPSFCAVFFFARLFGRTRETPEEQAELLGRMRTALDGDIVALDIPTSNAPHLFTPRRRVA